MVICLNYGHFEKELRSVIVSQNLMSIPFGKFQVLIRSENLAILPPNMFNRPGVAGDVLQSASSLIHSLIQSLSLFLLIINYKPEELEQRSDV